MTALGAIWTEIDTRLADVELSEAYERMPSGDPDVFPSLAGFDGGDMAADSEESFSSRRHLEITVEGYVKGSGGAATHAEMIELHADVVFALCGDAGSNLGGIVENIEIWGNRRVSVLELSKDRRLSFAQDFRITYATRRGDPHYLA